MSNKCATIFAIVFLISSIGAASSNKNIDLKLNGIAENYVRLVLKAWQLDFNLVDSYYGPDRLKPEPLKKHSNKKLIARQLIKDAEDLINQLEKLLLNHADKSKSLRMKFLYKQLSAIKAKILMLSGKRYSFDEESLALYGATSPDYNNKYAEDIIKKIDRLLPGSGSVSQRLAEYRKQFVVPKDKITNVFNAAIDQCRKQTKKNISLPKNEDFKVEYVTGKSWAAYNWYKGNNKSIIQVNLDMPFYVGYAVDLAAHEGYPGHHVYNTLIETYDYKKNGWIEYSILPLFSSQTMIEEGSANYGVDFVMSQKERMKFEKEVLFPMAGLDSSKAEKYYEIISLLEELDFAVNYAAKNYLDGKWNKEKTKQWLVKYTLTTPERAEQKIKFIEDYRSYYINYNVGKTLVKNYIEKNGGTDSNPKKRWKLFRELLITTQIP